MTTDLASAVAVTIPILALAAGAEARGIRERLKQPDEEWERKFAEYSSAHALDTAQPPSEVLEYFKGVPWVSKAYVIERLLAVLSAVMWLTVFVLLAIAELLDLVWLGDGASPAGSSGLAVFSVVTVGISLGALITAPAIYLFAPVLVPFDLLPHGLKKAVAPKLADANGRGFLKLLLHEFEGAIERAADKTEAALNPTPPVTPTAPGPATASPPPATASPASRPAAASPPSATASPPSAAAAPRPAAAPASRPATASPPDLSP